MTALRADLQTARLQPNSLRQQAARVIRAQIISGAVEAGQLYTIGYFAERFGVSPTPVRDALSDLAHEGLVTIVRNRGFQVVEVSEQDVDESLEVRRLLEVPATAQVAGRLTAEDIEVCLAHVCQIEEAAVAGDVTAYLDSERQFHLHILQVQGNRRIIEIISRLRDQARLYNLRALTRYGPYMIAAAPEHRHILQALVDGDVTRVETLMRRHLTHTHALWTDRSEEAQ